MMLIPWEGISQPETVCDFAQVTYEINTHVCSIYRSWTAAKLKCLSPLNPHPPITVGHGSDRNRPLGPTDLKRQGSGSAHIQLFLSLKCNNEHLYIFKAWKVLDIIQLTYKFHSTYIINT